MIPKKSRWQNALDEIWFLNRVHVSTEMSLAYKILKKYYNNLKIFGYKSGNKVNGWEIPEGWDVVKGFLKDSKGKIITDWSKNKLSLWTYSPSFKGRISKKELLKKIIFDKKKPTSTLFHFRNQYNSHDRNWGFSLPYNKVKSLKDKNYNVDIETKFFQGKLEMAEQIHHGSIKESILLVGHFDHPQMCLDGLIGCLAGHEVLTRLKKIKTRYTYRMLSTVEIIGSVFYAKHFAKKNNIKEALFLATSGAPEKIHYQNSFAGNNLVDKASNHCLKFFEKNSKSSKFRKGPLGNDEIAFDVGGIDIPCGSIMRAPFKTYHTDKDNPSAVSNKHFEEMVEFILQIIFIIENNYYIQRNFSGLPKLSSKVNNLYLQPPTVSGLPHKNQTEMYASLYEGLDKKSLSYVKKNTHKWNYLMNSIPNLCNGDRSILDIAEFTDLPFKFVFNYLELWKKAGLIKKIWR